MTYRPLVAIRTFLTKIDADLAATVLEAAGIASVIRADDCGGIRPHLWMGGIELLVASDEVDAARAILDSPAIAKVD